MASLPRFQFAVRREARRVLLALHRLCFLPSFHITYCSSCQVENCIRLPTDSAVHLNLEIALLCRLLCSAGSASCAPCQGNALIPIPSRMQLKPWKVLLQIPPGGMLCEGHTWGTTAVWKHLLTKLSFFSACTWCRWSAKTEDVAKTRESCGGTLLLLYKLQEWLEGQTQWDLRRGDLIFLMCPDANMTAQGLLVKGEAWIRY